MTISLELLPLWFMFFFCFCLPPNTFAAEFGERCPAKRRNEVANSQELDYYRRNAKTCIFSLAVLFFFHSIYEQYGQIPQNFFHLSTLLHSEFRSVCGAPDAQSGRSRAHGVTLKYLAALGTSEVRRSIENLTRTPNAGGTDRNESASGAISLSATIDEAIRGIGAVQICDDIKGIPHIRPAANRATGKGGNGKRS